jgi:uncharacterized protein (DUF1778 family)
MPGKGKPITTSLSVRDPQALAAIRRAAGIVGENLSTFMVRAASIEAAKILGKCPSCGQRVEKGERA